jgi:hypothetical protein
MARLAGFEPTTPWFVAKYSIQLSYSRTLKLYYLRLLNADRKYEAAPSENAFLNAFLKLRAFV